MEPIGIHHENSDDVPCSTYTGGRVLAGSSWIRFLNRAVLHHAQDSSSPDPCRHVQSESDLGPTPNVADSICHYFGDLTPRVRGNRVGFMSSYGLQKSS